jgi:hypothetical protein
MYLEISVKICETYKFFMSLTNITIVYAAVGGK